MDVRYFKLFIFALTVIAIRHTEATAPMCVSTYKGCRLNFESLPGPKGDQGEPGISGPKGLKGDRGYQGEMGPPGEKGDRGFNGQRGEKGFTGFPGYKGAKGDKGHRGLEGPPGLKGLPGNCGCKAVIPEVEVPGSDADGDTEPAGLDKDNPAGKSCKYLTGVPSDGIIYMGPAEQTFEVYCNKTSKETCVRSSANTKKINMEDINTNNKPFWLSEYGVDLKDLYNLTMEQLSWLQKQSSSVRQTLRYHCRDSVPYTEDQPNLWVQLLTWNDIVIGPKPTDKTPFSYKVPPDTNKCTKGENKYQSTDIVLESSYVNRLPVIDMQIRDIQNNHQEFYLESVEICFK